MSKKTRLYVVSLSCEDEQHAHVYAERYRIDQNNILYFYRNYDDEEPIRIFRNWLSIKIYD